MEIGDIVLVENSKTTIDAIGVVAGEAEYDRDGFDDYPRKRKVNWIAKNIEENVVDLNGGILLDRKTVYQLKDWRVDKQGLLALIEKYVDGDSELQKETRPYVFIIDEINRGNISKIFGELITLIEETKRSGEPEETSAILPYSKVPFSVPNNVYLLGTMNTADRSIALMDTALRRRFSFVELMPDPGALNGITVEGLDIESMLKVINERITILYDREHTIGHAFFMKLKSEPTLDNLKAIFKKSIIPLLQEYFYEDWQKIQLVLGDNAKTDDQYKFIKDEKVSVRSVFRGNPDDLIDIEKKYIINEEAFDKIESYIQIM